MKPNASLSDIASILSERSHFLVLSHIRPDGDAIGCSLAMGLCLRAMGKTVSVWNEDGLPQRFEFLPESALVQKPPQAPEAFDAVLVLDTAARARVGEKCLAAVKPGAVWINIDHHVSNDRKGDLVYVDAESPAAAQVLFEFFTQASLPLTSAMASALYTGMSTDTGSFQYPNTTARTYEIAAELVKLGVRPGEINQALYETHPRRRIALQRELLNQMRFSSGEKVASFALRAENARQLQIIPDDTEGLIDLLRGIEGVLVAAFFEEMDAGMTRISLRSKTPLINVCEICAEFGGGGHNLAAGARIAGGLSETEAQVLAAIDQRLHAAGLC